MTVKELREVARYSKLKVVSARDGRVLGYDFHERTHPQLADLKISSVCVEIEVSKPRGFSSNVATAVMKVSVVEGGY